MESRRNFKFRRNISLARVNDIPFSGRKVKLQSHTGSSLNFRIGEALLLTLKSADEMSTVGFISVTMRDFPQCSCAEEPTTGFSEVSAGA